LYAGEVDVAWETTVGKGVREVGRQVIGEKSADEDEKVIVSIWVC
jgi:hypothetical protein